MNNQLDNQLENQVENQDDKNISCSVFLEQINLINQLPLKERGNVIYMALLNAFVKNQNNQLDNQLENTYISISTSISLSILSKSVLDILNKTINCKKYKNNWGGKRKNAGRPKGIEDPEGQKLYGEYQNVCLTDAQYNTLLGMCLSKKLLDELIEDLSKNIGRGKVEPYSAKYPEAHYIQLKSYYDYRKKYPDKFRTAEESKQDPVMDEWYRKEKARLAAKGIY